MAIIKEFKDFINRGNVLDLAVGVIVGGAFTSIVNSLVTNVVTPLIQLCGGGTTGADGMSVPGLTFVVNGATFKIGDFLGSIINFLIVAFVVFLIVKAFNKAQTVAKVIPVVGAKDEEPEPEPRLCPYCRQEIDEDATRCPHCTSILPGFNGDR